MHKENLAWRQLLSQALRLNNSPSVTWSAFTTGTMQGRSPCEQILPYQNSSVEYPVMNGLFVVEAHSGQLRKAGREHSALKRPAVLLQVTLAEEHPTDTNKPMSLKKALCVQISNWEDFGRGATWEMICFRAEKAEKMPETQQSTISGEMRQNADHMNECRFWNTSVQQHRMSVKDTALLVRSTFPQYY
ncbi:hypothetical protein TRVL_06970 [Trypanosoma vivax]|nr:hypothetical protein TRVL_06970 [Trypanosoma vivax]